MSWFIPKFHAKSPEDAAAIINASDAPPDVKALAAKALGTYAPDRALEVEGGGHQPTGSDHEVLECRLNITPLTFAKPPEPPPGA